MKILKSLTVLSLILISSTVSARPSEIEMADAMLENGKIYVVIAVLCTVFMGLVVYTIMIDRKLSKLEKEVNEK
ncbi:MAG: CcmD family protein [Flavobacteriales bacterium]|jgi:CcmD family protein|nr:CcmD family protein [Flavobacteriales bacterium]